MKYLIILMMLVGLNVQAQDRTNRPIEQMPVFNLDWGADQVIKIGPTNNTYYYFYITDPTKPAEYMVGYSGPYNNGYRFTSIYDGDLLVIGGSTLDDIHPYTRIRLRAGMHLVFRSYNGGSGEASYMAIMTKNLTMSLDPPSE